MKRDDDVLGRVRVAKPCPVAWEGMEGDRRVRHCDLCHLKVYNLSGMTRQEAARLIRESQGRLCVRYYRRADGTILTEDCPVGLRKARKKLARALACIAALFLSLCSYAIRWHEREDIERRTRYGGFSYRPSDSDLFHAVLNRLDPPQEPVTGKPMMGAVAGPPPTDQKPPK